MSTLIECDIGDRPRITGSLRDGDGQPVTGATVTARALHNGTELQLGAAEDNEDGSYTILFTPDAPGKWEIRFESADPALAAEEGVIWVRRTHFST